MEFQNLIKLTDNNFDDFIQQSDRPIIVNFYDEWSAVCRYASVAAQQISKKYEGHLFVCYVDIDESPLTTIKYGIRIQPTIIFFKNGARAGFLVGAVTEMLMEERFNLEIKN